jgi:hypothetical protein
MKSIVSRYNAISPEGIYTESAGYIALKVSVELLRDKANLYLVFGED